MLINNLAYPVMVCLEWRTFVATVSAKSDRKVIPQCHSLVWKKSSSHIYGKNFDISSVSDECHEGKTLAAVYRSSDDKKAVSDCFCFCCHQPSYWQYIVVCVGNWLRFNERSVWPNVVRKIAQFGDISPKILPKAFSVQQSSILQRWIGFYGLFITSVLIGLRNHQ